MSNTTKQTEIIDLGKQNRSYMKRFYKAKFQINDNMTEEEKEKVKLAKEKRNAQARKRYAENAVLRANYQKRNRERYVPKKKRRNTEVSSA
tara:strand:- start:4321 stop:4593 length:273 start_codon:yes stop_codon:yes gene_type:complete